jgi:hypothetical protein
LGAEIDAQYLAMIPKHGALPSCLAGEQQQGIALLEMHACISHKDPAIEVERIALEQTSAVGRDGQTS